MWKALTRNREGERRVTLNVRGRGHEDGSESCSSAKLGIGSGKI